MLFRLLFGFLIAMAIASAYLRTSAPLLCASNIDLFLGYIGGIICGLLWYVCIYSLENSYSPPLDLTYFNNASSSSQKCTMNNKKFVCSKTKK